MKKLQLNTPHRENIEKQELENYSIFFDVDGTLITGGFDLLGNVSLTTYKEENKEVIESFRNQIQELYNKGMTIGISTGRSLEYIYKIVEVYFPSKIRDKMILIGENGVIYQKGKNKNNFLEDPRFLNDMEIIKQDYIDNIRQLGGHLEKGKEVIVSINPPDGTSTIEFANTLKDLLPKLNATHVIASSSAIDFLPKGIDKWNTIKHVINNDNFIIYAGDSGNDKMSIENSDIAIIPANANEQITNITHNKDNYIVSELDEIKGIQDCISHIIK